MSGAVASQGQACCTCGSTCCVVLASVPDHRYCQRCGTHFISWPPVTSHATQTFTTYGSGNEVR